MKQDHLWPIVLIGIWITGAILLASPSVGISRSDYGLYLSLPMLIPIAILITCQVGIWGTHLWQHINRH